MTPRKSEVCAIKLLAGCSWRIGFISPSINRAAFLSEEEEDISLRGIGSIVSRG